MELEKAYDHTKVEGKIYKQWEESGFFNPDNLPAGKAGLKGEPYTIVLPPPNVTGTLHVGHALTATIEDILIRYKRMQGYKTLWLPGTDHAAIATQSKVEKLLEKEEGKKKRDVGREEFLKRVEKFAQESHDTIISQLKSMGASLDWSREAFTLDEKRNLAVRTAFKSLYDLGLIYRGYRVINWDVKGQTTISDDEIVYQERPSKLYTFKYSKGFPISISTTRPETKVGDTAVAVHPDDQRYAQYVGKEYNVVFCGVPIHIKIIADKSVEKDFGTGALGVTPAHSMVDYEIAQRHNLPLKQVINEFGKMTVGGEKLMGKKAEEARTVVVDWLRAGNLLEKEEDITQNVATAERTGGIIEPLPKLQWFIEVDKRFKFKDSSLKNITPGKEVSLKELMRSVVESGQIKITPGHFDKTYFHWIDNLRDWCISRQIWYGHRIPVWYKGDKVHVDVNPPTGEGWMQDEDTLDTWFSSGLWTFSTLGWPEKTKDLQTFHPTDVLETGYDILFFWVARMILMTTALTGQIPFKNVFLHGIIRDANKQKMSKSKGNVVDPLEMTAKYGTDALRFALIFNTAPGTDMAIAEDKIKGMKHFANKLWNIARFILSNDVIARSAADEAILSKEKIASSYSAVADSADRSDARPNDQMVGQALAMTDADKDILNKLDAVIKISTEHLENFRLHEAAQEIYHFVWHEFADVYIEASKNQLKDEHLKQSTLSTLNFSLLTILQLLHPFMPFITEEIWRKLGQKDLLMINKWPI
jgi:valyl-tRNA synthetase